MSEIVGLLLAAGSASRFGSDKLHHALPHGVPIAIQSARQLRAELDTVIAVVRPGQDALADKLAAEKCQVVVCDDAAQGMGASLACAARVAGEQAGYLIALGDMPFIRRSTIAAVRDALARGAPLAAPYFRAKRGHPVGFSSAFRGAMLSLGGDEGAKRLLKDNESRIVKVPVGDPGVLRDIDRPEDLAPPAVV